MSSKNPFILKSIGSTSKGEDGLLSEKKMININMRILYVNPKELKINPLNKQYFEPLPPGEYERLKKDIEERGMQDPLQVKRDHTILAGENRFKIALELELSRVPIVYKDVLNEEEEIKFIVSDNLLRRQLTAAEKKELLKKIYGDEIAIHGKIGGDKRSKEAKDKGIKSEPFTKKVSRETGIAYKTTERYLAEIRKESKEPKEQKNSFPSSFDRLEKQLNSVKKTINKLEQDERQRTIALLEEILSSLKESS